MSKYINKLVGALEAVSKLYDPTDDEVIRVVEYHLCEFVNKSKDREKLKTNLNKAWQMARELNYINLSGYNTFNDLIHIRINKPHVLILIDLFDDPFRAYGIRVIDYRHEENRKVVLRPVGNEYEVVGYEY